MKMKERKLNHCYENNNDNGGKKTEKEEENERRRNTKIRGATL